MLRLVYCVFAVGLLALASSAADNDTITLKDYKPTVGDRVRVTEEERTTSRTIIASPDKRDDKLEKKTKVVVYVAETLAVKEGEKKAVRVKRTYEKAEETVVYAGMMVALPSEQWEVFGRLPACELAGWLREWSGKVNLKKFRKAPPRKPTKRKAPRIKGLS
jgi:hypothetical protein